MNFKGRYSIVLVCVITFMVVFFMPFGNHEPKCKKCLDCSELLNEISGLPSLQRDLVVVRSNEIANKSFDELRLLRLRQMLNEKIFKEPKVVVESGNLLFRHHNDFVVNCMTNNKLIQKDKPSSFERTNLDHIKNANISHQQNVTLARESWLKTYTLSGEKVEELVTLNILVTQIKKYLQKDTITLLHVFCGELHGTFVEEFVRMRKDVVYTGIDTSVNVISAKKKLPYVSRERTKYYVYDIIENGLKRRFDLVLILNADQFLSKERLFTLLQTVSQSNSTFLLSDVDIINPNILQGITSESGSAQVWNLIRQPNLFNLQYPVCLSRFQATKVLSLWNLPLQQIITNRHSSYRNSSVNSLRV